MSKNFLREKGRWYLFLSALSLSVVVIFQNCAKGIQSQLSSQSSSSSVISNPVGGLGSEDGSGIVSPTPDDAVKFSEKITTAFIAPSKGQGVPINPAEITTAYRLGNSLYILDKTHFYEWSYLTHKFTTFHFDGSIGDTVFDLGLEANQTGLGGKKNSIATFWDPDINAPHGSEISEITMSVDWPGTDRLILWTKKNWYIFDKKLGRFLTVSESYPDSNLGTDRSLQKLMGAMPHSPVDFGKITTAVVLNDVIHILDDKNVYRYVPSFAVQSNPSLSQYSDQFMPILNLADVWGSDSQAPKINKDITHSYSLDFNGLANDLLIFNTTTEAYAYSKSRNRFLAPFEVNPSLGDDRSLRRIWSYNLGIWGELSYINLSPESVWSGDLIGNAFRGLANYPDSTKVVGSFLWRDHIFYIDNDGRFFGFNLRKWRFETAGELDPSKFGSGNSNNFLSVAWKGLVAPQKIQLIFQIGKIIYMVDPELKIFALDIDSSNFIPIKTLVPNIAGDTVLDYFKAKGMTDIAMLEEIKKFKAAFPHKGGLRFITQTKWYHYDVVNERFVPARLIEPDFQDELLSRVMRCDDTGVPSGLCRK